MSVIFARFFRALFAASVFATSLFATSPAVAQERERVALLLEAPPECIDTRALVARVERVLDRSFFVPIADADIIARGTILREDDAFVFTLELLDRAGQLMGRRQARRQGSECHALDRPIAIIIATLVELPIAPTTMALADEEPLHRATDENEHPPIPEPELPPASESQSAWELRSGAGLALSMGLVPDVGVGGSVMFGLVPDRDWPTLALEARILAPSATRDESGRGASFFLADAHLGVCPAVAFDILRIGGCAELGGGVIVADAIGLSNARTGVVTPLVTARLVLESRIVIEALDVRLTAGIDIPIIRDPFVRDAGTERETRIYESAPVALTTSIGIGAIGGS